jgi:hypothetical protein
MLVLGDGLRSEVEEDVFELSCKGEFFRYFSLNLPPQTLTPKFVDTFWDWSSYVCLNHRSCE